MAWKGNENVNHSKASTHSDKRDIVFSVHRKLKDNVRHNENQFTNYSTGLHPLASPLLVGICGVIYVRVENADT
jgi:hypothetical protein